MAKKSLIICELWRKSVHLSGLLIVVGYTLILHFFSERIAILAMTALLLILLEIEYIRIEHKPRIAMMFNDLFRKRERDNVSGAVFLVISCIISFAAFDYWIAVVALFMTVLGDLFAAIIGKVFGRTPLFKNKTILGTFAGFAANLIAGILILSKLPYLIFLMAIVATVTELITNKIDDNLTVPLFAGFAGQMMVYYFQFELPAIDFTFLGLF